MKKERFRCHVAVCLLLYQEDKLLMIRRANTGYGDGFYALPGGSIDGDEPLRRAMIREANEEIGILLTEEDVEMALVVHSAAHEDNPNELILFIFEVKNYPGVVKNMEPDKCDDIGFFDPNNLPENTLPGLKNSLKALSQGKKLIETNWSI